MLGAGNFVNATLLPAMKAVPGVSLEGIVSGSGMTARATADRFGFAWCAADEGALLRDERVTWLVVATRHDLHARQVIAGLDAGKDVFVEKPLALNRPELLDVARAQRASGRRLLVGFNRRFAPMMQKMRWFLAGHHRPLIATYRVNAGAVPREHWLQDPAVGGGRIIGEACHFIDALQFLIGSPIARVNALAVQGTTGPVDDEVMLTLTFEDGSLGSVIYAAGGDKAFSKERIEVIGDGRIAVLDDFRALELVRNGKRKRQTERLRADKGHKAEWQAIAKASAAGEPAPIPLEEIIAAHLATFAAQDSLREQRPIPVDAEAFWNDVAQP
jgi:predicted dehydrogenase